MTDRDHSDDDAESAWRPSTPRVASLTTLLLVLSLTAGAALAVASSASAGGLADQLEPNDDFDSASTLAPLFEYSTLDASTSDDDYYAATLARGDWLNLSVDFDHTEGDLDVLVYDPNRDVVAESMSLSDDEQVAVQAGVDGTYYVRVLSWNDSATTYAFSGSQSDGELPATDAFGYDDGFSSATPISSPFDRAELQITDRDVDVYAIEVEGSRRITATSRFDADQADIDLELYDPDRNLLTTSATDTDNESLSAYASDPGTYYVRVISDQTAYYSLHVSDVAATGATETDDGESADATEPMTTATTDAGTTTKPPTDSSTATTDEADAQREIESEQRDTTDRTTDAIGPGFGVFALLAAVALFVAGRRR